MLQNQDTESLYFSALLALDSEQVDNDGHQKETMPQTN